MAAVNAWLGESDLIAAIVLAGFADPHSAAISVTSLVESNKLGVRESALLILAVLTADTVTKIVIAISAEGGGLDRSLFQGGCSCVWQPGCQLILAG